MALDLAGTNPKTGNSSTVDLADIMHEYPMREGGATGTAKDLKSHLSRYVTALRAKEAAKIANIKNKIRLPRLMEGLSKKSGEPFRPAEMTTREFRIVRQWLGVQQGEEAWMESLKDIDFASEREAKDKLEEVKQIIRKRMRKAWGLPP